MTRIATWNIGCGAKGFHGADPDGIAAALAGLEADACLLQEVDRFARRSGFVDFPERLARGTGMHPTYCASLTLPSEDGVNAREYGNLILTRDKPFSARSFLFPGASADEGGVPAEREIRSAVMVRVDAVRPVWLACAHLAYSPSLSASAARRMQARALAEAIDLCAMPGEPVALGGDFNAEPASGDLVPLARRLTLSTPEIGSTWPFGGKDPINPEPFASIDHFFTRGFAVSRALRIDNPGLSDHSIVLIDAS
jgi:endonuclease/exonuclease/phosphatase family metal-dependent hydrolase